MSRLHKKVEKHIGAPVEQKKDHKGRLLREIRCLNCRFYFGDEYIYAGRLRLRCPNCGKITAMEFRRNYKSDGRSPSKQLSKKEQSNE